MKMLSRIKETVRREKWPLKQCGNYARRMFISFMIPLREKFFRFYVRSSHFSTKLGSV